MDPYNILQVDRTASDQEIKSSFRKLAAIHHPDKNRHREAEAQKKTAEIVWAKEVLLDPRKRAIYNQRGNKGLEEFEQNGAMQQQRDLPILDHTVQVDLDAFYSGKLINFSIRMAQGCTNCSGHGCTDLSKKIDCSTCKGHGKVNLQQNMGFFTQTHVVDCRQCNGRGSSFERKFSCSHCSGSGSISKSVQVSHYIKKGDDYGQFLLENKGEFVDSQTNGHIRLSLTPPTVSSYKFKRYGSSLTLDFRISLREALLGFHKTIQHIPAHRNLVLTSDQVVQPGTIFKLAGWGMPKKNAIDQYGCLNVVVTVEFPTSIDENSRKLLGVALPQSPSKIDEDDEKLELTPAIRVEKEEIDLPEPSDEEQPAAPRVHMMHGGGVQCAQQ